MALIVSHFNTPVGCLEVSHDGQHVQLAVFVNTTHPSNTKSLFCQVIANELDEYFKHPHHRFQLPLKPQGTAYQLRVWNALLVIPAGRTVSYGDLAISLQSGPRAIGQACKKNPLAVFIPCHRVVGKNNSGGYMGREDALPFKLALLSHEAKGAIHPEHKVLYATDDT